MIHYADLSRKAGFSIALRSGTILRFSLVLTLIAIPAALAPLGADVRLERYCEISGRLQGARMLLPQAIALDPQSGEIYIADTGNRRILILGSGGELRGRFACRGGEPIGVAVSSGGAIYVTSSGSGTIDVYDYKGRLLRTISPKDSRLGKDPVFGRMSIDKDDRLYAVVPNRKLVACFDLDGRVRLVLSDPERMEAVSDVCAAPDGTVYVVDSAGTPLRRFDRSGKLLGSFGRHANGPQDFSLPTALEVDSRGRIWVVDSFTHVVKLFDHKGRFLENFGTFYYPVDVAVSPSGSLFVLEKGGGRVTCWHISDSPSSR